jgi:hypothetical protein
MMKKIARVLERKIGAAERNIIALRAASKRV